MYNVCSFFVFCVYAMLFFLDLGCQYQCNRLPGKTRLRNDLLCVERDVKPYHTILPSSIISSTSLTAFRQRLNQSFSCNVLAQTVSDDAALLGSVSVSCLTRLQTCPFLL